MAVGALTIGEVKTFLGLSGNTDDARLIASVNAAEITSARYIGVSQILDKAYLERVPLRSPDRLAVFARHTPLARSPLPQLTLVDGGFGFFDAAVAVGSDSITAAFEHGIDTGDGPFRLSTTGSLPSGLAAGTDYWAIRVDVETIKLAASKADAEAGTPVDITAAAGGGHHELVGPMEDPEDFQVDYATGEVVLGFFGGQRFTGLLRGVALLYTAGFGATEAAVKAAYPDLHEALVRQAAFTFADKGRAGRLGISRQEVQGGGVVSEFVVGPWAPGVRAVLDQYKRRRL